MIRPDKRKRSGFVRVGSATHEVMLKIAAGLSSDKAEPAAIKNLAAQGYIVRTYSLTEAGKSALSNAMEIKRKSRSASEFDSRATWSALSKFARPGQ